MRDNLWDNLWANLRDNLWANLRDKKLEYFGTDSWGQMDASWICYYLFPALHLGIKYKPEDTDKLNLWSDVSKSCGWWWPHENICIISDRPKSISFDEQWQLHSEIGPALLFRDGYSVYANHSVRHEGWFVEHPETITADKIAQESNIEIRRIMIERMGHGQYLQETGSQIVDMDSIPIGGGVDGAIIRALLKDKNGLQFLCGSDGSTNRVYYMSVDPNAKTCGQAHESICGFSEKLIIANA